MHTTRIVEMLGPIIPACVGFGPLFLLFGILLRTSTKPIKAPWKATAYLYAGTVMVTLALMHFLSRNPISCGPLAR